MRLLSATIEGYKRFSQRTSLRLDDRLIAIIGPNEAGKTSLLKALAGLDQEDGFSARERTRGGTVPPRVEVTFRLDDADKAALLEVPGGPKIERLTVMKEIDGSCSWTLHPYPYRDKVPRQLVLTALRKAAAVSMSSPSEDDVLDLLRGVLIPLDTTEETLPQELLRDLAELQSHLSLGRLPARKLAAWDDIKWDELRSDITDLIIAENNQHPSNLARSILDERRPRFLLFDQEDRELVSSYDLDEVAANPPNALDSLAHLAGLDLVELHACLVAGDYGRAEHLEEGANRELGRRFSTAWGQSEIVVRFRLDNLVLRILVGLPGGGYSAVDERSDGLLWFVALFAFLAGQRPGSEAILLVDEAETHLHYDAQADLVQVMNTLQVVHAVIYTTHSAGCLPPDLGRGIRVVVADEGERSHLENSFWGSSGAGYGPLLMAMGATVLAFSALRRTVICEGPSEAILLPTLLREVTGADRLPYQVTPGLAVANDLTGLGDEAARIAYLVDGDSGGEVLRDRLVTAGVDLARILNLGTLVASGFVLEDLVDGDAYVEALNEELRRWQTPLLQIALAEVEGPNRPAAVVAWCEKHGVNAPTKVGVANRLVEMSGDREVANAVVKTKLVELDGRIRDLLQ